MAVNILLKRSATASKRPVGASMAFGELNLNYDAATGGLYYKNSNGDVVKVGPCQVSATAPNSTPAGSAGNSAGEFWFDTATQTLKLYDGTTWVEAGGMVQGITGSAPITVNNTDPLNPIVGINAASTTAPGAVQLNDTTTSSSTTEALTANQGRILQTQIDALVVSSNLTFAGTIDASTGDVVTVSTEGAAAGFTIGDPLPSPAAGNTEYFVIVTVPGTMTPPGGSAQACHQGDWWLSDGTVWNFLDVGYNAPYATTAVPGIVQLATDAEVQAGVNTDHAVVPSSLQSKLSDSVSTTSSTTIASSTAAKAAYDAGVQGQTDAAAAQATANAAMPKAGGNFTGNVTFDNGTSLTLDPGSNFLMDGTGSFSGTTTFEGASTTTFNAGSTLQFNGDVTSNGSVNLENIVNFGPSSYTEVGGIFAGLSGSSFEFNAGSSVTVDGSFTFNTAPTFPVGVNIGAAAQVTYDNVTSGLAATNVQDAIDEVDGIADAALPKAGGEMTGNIVLTNNAKITTDATTGLELIADLGTNFLLQSASGGGQVDANTLSFSAQSSDADALSIYTPGTATIELGTANLVTSNGLQVNGDAGTAGYILTSNGPGAAPTWEANSSGDVTSVSGTAPITVDNTDPQNPVIGIDAATTLAAGAVQLNDTVTSTSTSQAATANAVKVAYDEAVAAAAAGEVAGIASDTVIFVNSTNGDDATGQRGTTKAFLTITAALAVAQNGDTVYLSPGSFTENVTLTKGINLVGTYNEQGMGEGTSIVGNFVYNMVSPAATTNPTINHIRFVSPNTTNAFKVLGNSFQAGGIATINDCSFTQAGDTSTTEFCFETAGTWSRSMYVRRTTFDGNVKHAAGTAAGASGYLVLDDILATGSASRHYNISTGTVEFRRPSNSISPVLQTGGVVLFTDCISGITPSNATTSPVFGGTNISYKGSAASVGTGTVYFNGYAPVSGVINIGANMVYGWSALNVTPANLTISGSAVPYTTAVPAAAATVTASQQRPRFDLLTATSSVVAANQLATVIDSSTGTFYTVSAMDAGTY